MYPTCHILKHILKTTMRSIPHNGPGYAIRQDTFFTAFVRYPATVKNKKWTCLSVRSISSYRQGTLKSGITKPAFHRFRLFPLPEYPCSRLFFHYEPQPSSY